MKKTHILLVKSIVKNWSVWAYSDLIMIIISHIYTALSHISIFEVDKNKNLEFHFQDRESKLPQFLRLKGSKHNLKTSLRVFQKTPDVKSLHPVLKTWFENKELHGAGYCMDVWWRMQVKECGNEGCMLLFGE